MEPASLKIELTAALPEGLECKIRYIRTSPKTCDPLFSAPSGQKPEDTKLASHMLTASVVPQNASTSKDVLVLAIEVLVFTTKQLTTVFVSKADSTGYLPQHRPSAIKSICTTYLTWLSNRLRQKNPSRKLVISLFARAQAQYLFPGSSENSGKHVLDDRQLIKWWARVLHPMLSQQDDNKDDIDAPRYQGYMTVPGYEKNELRGFFPRESLAAGKQHWLAGNPLEELAETRKISTAAPPRCLLPRFPDDPKARFMTDLDDEIGLSEESSQTTPTKRKDGRWTSIRDLTRFWEAMEFRQECASGRLVGFLWLVITPSESAMQVEEKETQTSESQVSVASIAKKEFKKPKDAEPKKKAKKLSGPIVLRKARLKGAGSTTTATASDATNNSDDDGLLLTKDGYDQAMQTLLHLDFANVDVAAKSTSKWAAEVSSIRKMRGDWAFEVVGTAKPQQPAASSGAAQVNNIGGMLVKKKRKATDDDGPDANENKTETNSNGAPVVNVLGAGMIRKKPKTS